MAKISRFNFFFPKKRLFILAILSFVSLFLLFRWLLLKNPKQSGLKTIYIKNQPIIVEIAQSQEEKSKGLSGREKLAPESGMLFIFLQAGYYHFWMKNMLFPLDFIWIVNDQVVDLTENASAPAKENEEKLLTFTSNAPADKVLEVNAGTIQSLKINIGDKVNF